MSYISTNLTLVLDSPSQLKRWEYVTTDSFSTVCGANYFNDAAIQGMSVGDQIDIVTYTTKLSDGTFTGLSTLSRAIITAITAGRGTASATGYVSTLTFADGTSQTTAGGEGSVNLATPNVWTGQQNFGAAALTDGATINWNLNTQQVAVVTLGGNRTLANPTNMVNGGCYVVLVKQDGTGGRLLSYGANYKWLNSGGTAPTLSTAPNAVDILYFSCDGTYLYGSAATQAGAASIGYPGAGIPNSTGTGWGASYTPATEPLKYLTDGTPQLYKMDRSAVAVDANGIFTTVRRYRVDGTLAEQSVLSGGSSPTYTTRTVTRYAADGATVVTTTALTLTYDVSGNLVTEA